MKKTNFYSAHKALGAKIVDFGGYEMPLQYDSIIAEHNAVRDSCGLFDVSHMGEVFLRGKGAFDFLQKLTTNDVSKLQIGRVQYSAICYEDGGIVDDLLVYRTDEFEYMLVINASNREKDIDWMKKNLTGELSLSDESDEMNLLALQGPMAGKILQAVSDVSLDIEYYHFKKARILNLDLILSRTGYTGELGYELYFKAPEEAALKFWDSLMEAGEAFGLKPAGLGSRDSLRLEMGYCLYGNDISEKTNPLEANLGWITKLGKGNFIGRDAIRAAKDSGLKRSLVGMQSIARSFPRHGYDVSVDGKVVGSITSGTLSPTLGQGIALGYLETQYAGEGHPVSFIIRGKEVPAKVVKLPFIKK